MLNLNERFNDNRLREFSEYLLELSSEIGFRVSSRGWAYLLETRRLINKNDFDKVTGIINKCRRKGFLPIDFIAEEDARAFSGIESPQSGSVIDDFASWLRCAGDAAEYYTPDWWDGENYYIQLVVEKIDLVTLFKPICRKYHIPIANSKGWSSMLQRAEYANRFLKAEKRDLQPLLLYCGDHDPDGLRISEFIRKNLNDLRHIKWSTGYSGYDPKSLTIDRFGLNYDFIIENNLTWIDNLITGSGLDLGSPKHKNHFMSYVQDYIDLFGRKKCEANAVVTMPDNARRLIEQTIVHYLGSTALSRFEKKRQAIRDELKDFLESSGLQTSIDDALKIIKERHK